MAPLERLALRRLRGRLVSFAQGRILEIGVGTGANLPYYPGSTWLAAIDESAGMVTAAARRATALVRCVALGQMSAESLAFPSGLFDTVVASLVLCSVVSQGRALDEVRRVLRTPGGRLLLLEHMRPEARPLARLVDLVNGPWLAWNGRCHLNRETQQNLIQAGFQIDWVESKLGGFLRLIVAHPG
jgi:ubiquinone/menaquinone biosynthesis C-methylase UbiE